MIRNRKNFYIKFKANNFCNALNVLLINFIAYFKFSNQNFCRFSLSDNMFIYFSFIFTNTKIKIAGNFPNKAGTTTRAIIAIYDFRLSTKEMISLLRIELDALFVILF